MSANRRPGPGQRGLPGLEHDRLWSRQPPRGDPLDDPDGCPDCAGTAMHLDAPEPDGPCTSCAGTGWRP